MCRLHARATDERGLGLVEIAVAGAVVALIGSVALAGFASSMRAFAGAKRRDVAEQIATRELEKIRSLPYASVGTVGGNPNGSVQRTANERVAGVTYTTTVHITYRDDPLPGGFTTAANYKVVTVTVAAGAGNVLARMETIVAPPTQPGLDSGVIRAQVVDFALNAGVQGVLVHLRNGPSNRDGFTDADGVVTFAGLQPNPVSGPQSHYDLTVPSSGGYETLREDLPPAPAAHMAVAPGQLLTTAIRIFRPATLVVELRDAAGQPFAQPATISIGSSRGSQAVAATGATTTVTEVGGEPVIPRQTYSLSASGAGYAAASVRETVAPSYPAGLTHTVVLTMQPATQHGLRVVVLDSHGAAVQGASIELTGGSANVFVAAATSSGGEVTVDVPAGTYQVGAFAPGDRSSAGTATVTVTGPGQTVTVTIQAGTD